MNIDIIKYILSIIFEIMRILVPLHHLYVRRAHPMRFYKGKKRKIDHCARLNLQNCPL
jgi:hypothetical protein